MHVLAFANQKGGCGKTTTAVHLAGALARLGRRVLLLDLDPQAHATLALGVVGAEGLSLIHVLGDGVPAADAIVHASGGVDVLPATEELAEFEEVSERMVYPEQALDLALQEVAEDYDYVLLDCPPRADGVLTRNALRACGVAVLAVECGAFALQGALTARRMLEELSRDRREPFRLRVVATLYDRRTRFARELLVALHARFGERLFETPIRTSVRLREAAAVGLPIQEHAPRSAPAADFAALAREVVALCEAAPAPSNDPVACRKA